MNRVAGADIGPVGQAACAMPPQTNKEPTANVAAFRANQARHPVVPAKGRAVFPKFIIVITPPCAVTVHLHGPTPTLARILRVGAEARQRSLSSRAQCPAVPTAT
jgi:hypothetical protein